MNKLFILPLILIETSLFSGNIDSYKSYFNALILEKSGKYEQAIQEYKKTIEIDPDPYVYKSAMDLAMVVGDIPSVLEYSKYMVEKDSMSAENWYNYANALWAANRIEEASEAFKKALEKNPQYAEAYYQLASLNYKDTKTSMYYLNKLISIRPDLKPEAYMRVAEIYLNNREIKKAEEYLLKAAKEDTTFTRPKYMLAILYEDSERWKEAIEVYKEIIVYDSRNVQILNKIGEIYLSFIKDYSSAEKYFLKALDADPVNAQALYWLSAMSEMNRDYKKAEIYARKLNSVSPSPSTAVKIGYYRSLEGDIKGAMDVLSLAFQKWPDDPQLAYFLALGYDDLKDNAKSREFLEKAIKLKPDYLDARMQLGIVCERLNDVKCFRENFEYVIEKGTESHMAMNYLGYSLSDRDMDLDYSLKLVNKALKLDPGNPAYLDSLAWVEYKKGNLDNALKNIEDSISKYPQDPVVEYHAGEIYIAKGMYDKAWKSLAISNLIKYDKKTLGRLKFISKKLDFANIFPEFISENYKITPPFEIPCQASLKFKGKKMSFDCHIKAMENGDFYIVFYDPFMAPSISFSFEKNEWKIKLPDFLPTSYEVFAIDSANAIKWLLSQKVYSLKATDWKKGYFEKDSMKFFMNKEKNFFGKIKTNSKITLFPQIIYTHNTIRISSILLDFHMGELSISFN